jgi:protein O-mannosyl-transferase
MTFMNSAAQIQHRKYFFIVLIIIAVFMAFMPCLKAGFLTWDDDKAILENYLVRNLSPTSVIGIFSTPILKTYTPLTQLFYGIEFKIFGQNPFIFHLNNLLLHLAVTLLIFLLAEKAGINVNAAGIAALLFGLHPMHVESVAWITERKDVLYAFFYLLSLWYYWEYIKQPKRNVYLLSLGFGFLSVLSKPMALSLPWILLLCDGLAKRKWNLKLFIEKIPFFVAIEGVAAITYSMQARVPSAQFPQVIYLWLWSAVFYIRKFFIPLHLSPMYVLPKPILLTNPEYLISIIFTIALVISLFLFRKNRAFVASVLFYIGSIFFMFQLDEFGGPNPVADRFMYLPGAGFCLWIGLLLNQFLPTEKKSAIVKWAGLGFITLLAGLLFAKTYNQCFLWQSSESLWGTLLRTNPDNPLVHNNRGEILSREGNNEAALAEFSEAIRLDPNNAEALYNKGLFLIYLGRSDEALPFFDKAIAINPRFAKAFNNKGFIYGRIKGMPKEAMENLDKAIEFDPYLPETFSNRGIVRSQFLEEYDEAIKDLSRAVELNPKYADAYYNRGIIYMDVKRQAKEAIADFSKTIELEHPDSYDAYNRRGFAYALTRQSTLALKDFNKAIAMNPDYFAPYYNRGSYYFEHDNYQKALENYQTATSLNPEFVLGFFLQAKTQLLMDNPDGALSAYQKVVELAPDFGEAYYGLSLVYKKLGNKKKAEENAKKAAELGFEGIAEDGPAKQVQQKSYRTSNW